jgi:hypothetical protein
MRIKSGKAKIHLGDEIGRRGSEYKRGTECGKTERPVLYEEVRVTDIPTETAPISGE